MAVINGLNSRGDFIDSTSSADIVRGLDGNDTIRGMAGNDSINGNVDNDYINANQGNDTIFGGKGNDSLFGGQGNDRLIGDLGNDFLYGDRGSDTLTGGDGNDLFVIGETTGGATLADADEITDFRGDGTGGTPRDLIGLAGGLAFDELNIFVSNGDTVIRDKLSGQFLVVIDNFTRTLIAQDFNIAPVPTPIAPPTDFNGTDIIF